jgi:hypothetical protein
VLKVIIKITRGEEIKIVTKDGNAYITDYIDLPQLKRAIEIVGELERFGNVKELELKY